MRTRQNLMSFAVALSALALCACVSLPPLKVAQPPKALMVPPPPPGAVQAQMEAIIKQGQTSGTP